MSLTSTVMHSSAAVRIRRVTCHTCDPACSAVEYSPAHTLVLPLSGVYLKHVGRHRRLIGDRHHALLFEAGEAYRISHPLAQGDDSLAFDFPAQVLTEALAGFFPDAMRTRHFARSSVRLEPPLILARQSLARSLRRRALTALEADEQSLELLSSFISTGETAARRPLSHAGGTTRQQQRVEATLVTLSSAPQAPWDLASLAGRVHSSPWHLAHEFSRVVGMPVHQFQLLARLSLALDHVLDSDCTLATLAADLGFSSHSHFTAAFRNCFGCTPTSLRREARSADMRTLRKNLTAKLHH